MYSCGQQDKLMIERLRGKADSLDALEGSSPGCAMASIQATIKYTDTARLGSRRVDLALCKEVKYEIRVQESHLRFHSYCTRSDSTAAQAHSQEKGCARFFPVSGSIWRKKERA